MYFRLITLLFLFQILNHGMLMINDRYGIAEDDGGPWVVTEVVAARSHAEEEAGQGTEETLPHDHKAHLALLVPPRQPAKGRCGDTVTLV